MSKRIKLDTIKKWGEGRDFGDEQLSLDVCSTIYNRKTFFDSHVAVLDACRNKKDKKVCMPYYQRLVQFYYLVENEKKGL